MASLGCTRVTGPISEGSTQRSIQASGGERTGTFLISECMVVTHVYMYCGVCMFVYSLLMCTFP